jgi:enterochelin esterase-like enzyme
VEKAELAVDALPQPLQYRVYLPPCYDELPDQHYPVLYLIHGQSFNDDQWERLGAPALVDRLSAKGELPPFIIVMPRDRVWSEPTEDRFGEAVVEALVPYIDASYRSIPERSKRAIGGLSRGGAWALHLGLSNWETFGAIGMHSGFSFQSDDANTKTWLDAIPVEQMPRFYIDISQNDQRDIAESAAWIKKMLTERAIAYEWHLYPGYHEEAYWQAHLEQYLRWYAEAWK